MTKQIKKQKKWSLKYCPGNVQIDAAVRALATEAGLSEILASLLYTRGYTTKEAVESFFHQDTACLHDPYILCDMQAAVNRLDLALERHEKIAIYGDYCKSTADTGNYVWILKKRG